MDQVAVELQSVTKRYGEVVAVDHVSLQIRDGEFFSLLGPSGCGKTTTLRMIAGLEVPTEGALYIHSVEMGQRPAFQRPVNTVFQSYALFPHMSVAENIAFGLKMKKVATDEIEARVQEALRMVRLEGFGKRKPKNLSGGQQQRVALARALVNRPEVLLLDEPLGALDLKLRKEMQLELKHLQQQVGITFIYVTHDQEEALVMSDRIAVMNRGRILQVGSPTEIYERPIARFVADFIGETNFLEGTLAEVAGDVGTVRVHEGITVQGRVPSAATAGSPVSLSVRPEKIHISDRPLNGSPNAFQVRVTHIAYVGSDTRIRVTIPGGNHFDVWEQNNLSTIDKDAYYVPGDEAWISWEPTNALILPE